MTDGERTGFPFRAFVPNAITALALCFGLTGVRFGITGDWALALACIVGAGVLDGFDGRIARLLKAQSKFGAELDSLSDNIAFGTAPALIVFLWSLQEAPRFGWIAALALAVCCALRLARFNARIDADFQPHKSAGFNTGVPAPVGAGLAFVPIYLWLISDNELFRSWQLVLPWILFIALLMISSVPTYTWGSIRIRRGWRLFALAGVALLGGCAVERAMDDPAGDLGDLSRAAAVQHRQLRRGQAAARSPGCHFGSSTASVRRGLKRIVTGRPCVSPAVHERPSSAAMIFPPSRRMTSTTRVRMKPNAARVRAAASMGQSSSSLRIDRCSLNVPQSSSNFVRSMFQSLPSA